MGRAKASRSSGVPVATSPFDPGYPANLKRSLARNDVELAALAKLHTSLRVLREAIVAEFGEDGLIRMVLRHKDQLKDGGLKPPTVQPEQLAMEGNDETTNRLLDNDTASPPPPRHEKLSSAFFLRMKLRRRLLNRLARRLHRVADSMDYGTRNVEAPVPPLYGDQMRRFVKDDENGQPIITAEGAKNVRGVEVDEFIKAEEEMLEVKKTLEERRQQRTVAVIENDEDKMDEDTPSPVDLLLKDDEEDKPLLDKLVEYEVGYDKVYTLGKPTPPPLPSPSKKSKSKPLVDNAKADDKKDTSPGQKKDSTQGKETNDVGVVSMTLPIVDTADTHKISEGGEGNHDSQDISRVPYHSFNGRAPPPVERATEWKRWTKEICDRIPDQVTFDDLGVGGDGVIFGLEARLESTKRKAGEDDVASNRGKGKVLRRSEEEREEEKPKEGGDVDMADANKKEDGKEETDKENTNENEKELTAKNAKPFSLKPVPSFYQQDLQRVKIIQNELIRFSNIYEKRELCQMAQKSYDNSYKVSVTLQQEKARLTGIIEKMTRKHQYDLAGLQQQAKHQIAQARAHWERRQWQLQDTKKKYGEEGALVRSVCNDILLEAKDRIEVRFAPPMPGRGSPQTAKAAFVAKQVGDEEKEEVANVLGHIVDCVDRRYLDMLFNHPKSFIPPPIANENTVVANSETGETLVEMQKRERAALNAQLEKVETEFKVAEQKRTAAWAALNKAKAEVGVAPTTTKPRKSAPARQIHPTQQQLRQQQQQQQQQQQRQLQQQKQYQQQVMRAQQAAQGQMLVPGPTGQVYVTPVQYQQMQMQQQQMHRQQMMADQTARIIQAQVSQQGAPSSMAPTQPVRQPVKQPVAQKKTRPVPVGANGEPIQPKKMTQNEKYGYGDRYSAANVQARINPDGTVFPVQQPKKMPNGLFARPAGRQRRGMDWDGKRGCWFPVPEGQGGN